MRGFLAYLVVLFLGIGAAQACTNPNPNLLAPPFVDGCDIPAVALNRVSSNSIFGGGTSTLNSLPVWGNTGGSLLKDGGTLSAGTQTNMLVPGPVDWTAQNIYDTLRVSINGFPQSSEFGGGLYLQPSAITGAILAPSNATSLFGAATGVSGYANTLSGPMASQGVLGVASASVANASVFGVVGLAENCPSTTCATNTGFAAPLLYGIESDVKLMKVGGAAPAAQVYGVWVTGSSETAPSSGGVAYGVVVGPMGTFAIPQIGWSAAIATTDAASVVGLSLGANAVLANNIDSQEIAFRAYGPSSALVGGLMYMDHLGNFVGNMPHEWFFQVNGISIAGIAPTALALFPGAPGASQASTPLTLNATNSGNSPIVGSLSMTSAGLVVLNAPAAGQIYLGINSQNVIAAVTGSPASAATGMSVLVNNNAGVNLAQVTLGAANSGGTGLRALVVPN